MAPQARNRNISRRSWLLSGLAFPLFRARAAETISVSYDGDNLRPVAPNVHFLAGSLLDRLKDGETVTYLSWLSLFSIDRGDPLRMRMDRFLVSYDIWEQKFKVTVPGPALRARAGLSGPQAEAWCLENMPISAAGLAPDALFFLRLELRGATQKDFSAPAAEGGAGISLRALIELFGRKAGPGDPRWGPFETARQRLADLLRTADRGARSG
jgi:hypothetical protein